MTAPVFEIRLCGNCGLRYPLVQGNSFGDRCPRCLSLTVPVISRPMTVEDPSEYDSETSLQNGPIRMEAILDNIRSEWNVGSIFRTADAIGVRKLYLCGITPTPNDQKLKKTALGAGDWIPWEHHLNAVLLAEQLRTKGCCLCAIEQDSRAVDITKSQDLPCIDRQSGFPEPVTIILILGNEVTGVDPGLLAMSESVISIAMRGRKRSLNVAIAFGIAAYQLSLLTKQ